MLGSRVGGSEQAYASSQRTDHCVSVANGSGPLEQALRALGIGAPARGAPVANAGFYASTAVHAVGARPLYVDVTEDTLTLCPDALAQALALAPKPAAVIA